LGIVALVGLAVVILVLFAQGTLDFPNSDEDETAAEFATAVLARKDLRTFKDLDGVLEYGDSVQISPSGSGVLTHIAPEGSQLDRGAVIFRLYKSIGDTDITIADQQIASASASVASAQLALQNLNTPATIAQIASANASVASAQLALDNLNEPATPAQIASANASVASAQLALDNLNEPATPAQIASANASVASAQLALDNLNEPATPSQIASANASVASAQFALNNLNATPTLAQIASADAAIIQAQLALDNLKDGPTPEQIASANRAIAQAEANLATAQIGVDTAWASRRIAHQAFCDAEENAEPPVFLYLPPICPVDAVALADSEKNTLLNMIGGDYLIAQANSLLNAYQGHQAALGSSVSAENSLANARDNLDALNEPPTNADLAQASATLIQAQEQRDTLDDPPTATQIAQASESLLSALENRAALDEPPTIDELAQASESLKSAQEHRAALDEPPGPDALAQASESLKSAQEHRAELDELPEPDALAQASESLKSAQEHRAELDEPPEPDAFAQAEASLKSARASLDIALANRDDLIEGPSAGVLMFGDVPAWREFQFGMSPGVDVNQLEQNLLALGYGSTESLNIDQIFDAETAAAITKMQVDLGIVATGRIAFGDVTFLPGTSVVESSPSFPSLGSAIALGSTLISLTPIERTETQIAQNGNISMTSESLQRVETTIEVADQDLIDIGSEVRIELPDESIVTGAVIEIGSIAVVPQGGQNDPYLEVTVAIQGDADLYEWTGAPVTASITKTLAENTLAAPVTSLLALLGGGYALEIIQPNSTRLVPVEAGVYADGWVEVTGQGLEDGVEVVTPQ
jgi:peptidoglycan hydrolase-like protein with peptidoglycan-binding domain